MGEVWLARDEELDEDLALKFLHPRLAGRAPLVELLKAECKRTRALLHPNIVRLFDFHRADERFYLSMEYLDGGDIARYRGESLQRLVPLLMTVADALAYAHGQGIVHRDLKTSNVLMDRNGLVKLTDFGIAGVLDPIPPQPWADRGGGSPRIVSPQQLAGGPPDPRDDIYSLGVLCRDLLAPEEADAAGAGPPDPGRGASGLSRRPGVPTQLAALVESMLAPQPENRPANMEQVRLELAASIAPPEERTRPPGHAPRAAPVDPVSYGGVTGSATPLPPSPAERPASGGRPRDNRLMVLTAAAFVFLGMMAVGVFWYLPRLVEERDEAPIESLAEATVTPNNVAVEAEQPTNPATGSAPAVRGPTPSDSPDLASLARTKTLAEDALDAWVAQRSDLQARGAEVWGRESFAAAQVLADQGDQWFLAEDYTGALQSYQAALGELSELNSRAAEVLADLLREGGVALENGQAETAVERYELALRVESGNEEAAGGLEKARKLLKVNQLVAEANVLEQAGQLQEAAKLFREALLVDPEASPAKEGIARVDAALSEAAYQEQMSLGLTALEAGDYAAAQEAFDTARKLRPEAAGVNDALVRLRQAMRRQRIAAIRARAQALRRQQRWAAAAEQYRAALAIDSTLVFAQQGAAQTTRWAGYEADLSRLLGSPARLYSPQPYEEAVELLHDLEVNSTLPSGIESKTAELARLVDVAGKKIKVSLISDLQTDVVVYRVGKLGRFERRDLQLRPGSYTVVGSCAGYRDVRHTIKVEPERAFLPLVVRCVEKI
jgi:tetratricopeptide (TPR) repeat protein